MEDDAAFETAFARAARMIRAEVNRLSRGPRQLLVTNLTRLTGLSATPVREVLSRLVGEGLIEDRRGHGYFTISLGARDIAERYALTRIFALAAISRRDLARGTFRTRNFEVGSHSGSPRSSDPIGDALERIAIDSGNRLLAEEMRRLNARMIGIRSAESEIFPATDQARISEALRDASSDSSAQAGWVEEYCAVGEAHAEELADWLSG